MRRRTFWHSLIDALRGLSIAVTTQRNMRIHLLSAAAAMVLGLWLQIDAGAWSVLVLTIALVICTEVMNTAIEAMVDLLSPEYRTAAKLAKDLGAASVLFAALMAICVGMFIFGPPLWDRLCEAIV